VTHGLGNAQRNGDEIGQQECPDAQTDGHRKLVLHELPDTAIMKKALAQIEGKKTAHHVDEALVHRFIKTVECLDLL